MSQFDTARNVVHAQLLYWGPEGSGKTATLECLRARLDPERRTRLYSIASPGGGTLTFDLFPIDEFKWGPARVRLRVLATPGTPSRSHARLALLKDADAVCFVADARRGREEANLASWQELQGTLRNLGVESGTLPTVLAFNHRDVPESAPASELQSQLSLGRLPCYETAATEGTGVMDCFGELFRALLESLAERYALAGVDVAAARPAQLLPQLVRGVAPSPRPPGDRHLVIQAAGNELAAAEQAIRAQLGLVLAHVEADATNRRLEDRNKEMVAVNRVARSILGAMETDNLLVVLLDATADYLSVSHATCVLFDPTEAGALRTHVRGFGRDPALGLREKAARRFFELLRDSDGPVPLMAEHNPELLKAMKQVDRRVQRAMFQPIKGDHDKPSGWIGIYHTADEPRVTTQGLLFLSSIARLAALGLEKIALLERMQKVHARLEANVRGKTGELEMANARIRALNRGLESRVKERVRALEDANRKLKADRAGAVHEARLHAMGDVASSLAKELSRPVVELGAAFDALREGLDELRARIAAAAPDGAGLPAVEEFAALVDGSGESVRRVTQLVASLGRFGGTDEASHRFSLNTLAADAAALLEERIEACADLELSLGTLPQLEGSSVEMGHVVLGLLTNAVEAVEKTGRRGRIHVTTFSAPDRVTLILKDDGCGMDEELLGKVFEPFAASRKDEPGAGLGLHAAYRILQARGGTLRIKSKPDQGTMVTLTHPTLEGPSQARSFGQPAQVAGARGLADGAPRPLSDDAGGGGGAGR